MEEKEFSVKFKRKVLDGNMFVYFNRWEGRVWRYDVIRLIDMLIGD